MKMEIVKDIFDIMSNLGIKLDNPDENESLESFITNSYQQVKLVIEIEKKFHISIPERLLIAVDDISIKEFASEIEKLL